jgi:hypothetical protein
MLVDLTAERLRELLHYEPLTGIFTWLVSTNGRVIVGDVAGCVGEDGYSRISIDGRKYMAHRLAWFYVHGEWPGGRLDHRKNKCFADKSDNRIANLRPASHSGNLANTGPSSNNSSGFKGVSWHKQLQKWAAQIEHNGKRIYLGLYPSAREAALHHDMANRCLNGPFSYLNFPEEESDGVQLPDRVLDKIYHAREWIGWLNARRAQREYSNEHIH